MKNRYIIETYLGYVLNYKGHWESTKYGQNKCSVPMIFDDADDAIEYLQELMTKDPELDAEVWDIEASRYVNFNSIHVKGH